MGLLILGSVPLRYTSLAKHYQPLMRALCVQKEFGIFTFNESFQKAKVKLLVLSGISLFIALTEALPQKVSLLGLDLSSNPKVAGWFILAVTVYFLFISFLYGALDLIKHYLPTLILKKTQNLSGSTLGLTEEECVTNNEPHYLEQPEVGTPSSELADIREQKLEIENKYNSNFITASNIAKIAFEYALPIIFGLYSMCRLQCFLSQAS